MEYVNGKDYHLLHSFIGNHAIEFGRLMRRNNRDPDYEKFMNFYHGGNSVKDVEKSLGLDLREILCCISKKDPAVTYHRPYGLILDGDIKIIYDNDSGTYLSEEGIYSPNAFDFTNESNLKTILNGGYDNFSKCEGFYWNEAVLKKRSKIIGAFHDLEFNPARMRCDIGTFREEEYGKFLEKVKELKLDLIPINAKFKR